MTKRTLIQPAAFMAISLMLFQAFHANAQTDQKSGSSVPSFNFSYRIAGDRAAAPLQAFDDGKKTHLQFRDLNSVPAIFADTPAGKILLKEGADYNIQPPFIVLHKIEPEIMLIMNKRQAFVSYKGPPSEGIVQTPAMYGAKQPMTVSGSVRLPEVAEVLASRPGMPSASPTTTATGRPQNSAPLASSLSTGETVVSVAPAANAQPGNAPTAAGDVLQGQPAPAQEWKIAATDKSVRHLLERWSKDVGYQLLWEIPVDLQLGATATLTGSFEDALNAVLASLDHSDYPIEAMIYDNRVVRVVKTSSRNK